MLDIGALGALEVLAGKCAFWRPSGWKRAAGGRAGLDLVSRQSNGKGLWLIQP